MCVILGETVNCSLKMTHGNFFTKDRNFPSQIGFIDLNLLHPATFSIQSLQKISEQNFLCLFSPFLHLISSRRLLLHLIYFTSPHITIFYITQQRAINAHASHPIGSHFHLFFFFLHFFFFLFFIIISLVNGLCAYGDFFFNLILFCV